MSRIYDALKRAAEKSKHREALVAPPPAEKAAAPIPDAPQLGRDDVPLADPIQEPAFPLPLLEPLGEHLDPDLAERAEPEESFATSEPETYREQVRKALRANLALKEEEMAREGKHLFEGSWLTVKQIRGLRRRLKWKALGILFQIILLFGFMGFMNLLLLWALKLIVPL